MALFLSVPCMLDILGISYMDTLHSVSSTTIWGKRQFLCGFGDFSSLGQKLPFWNKRCRFRDINCRFEDKLPFKTGYFRKGYFQRFFIVEAKIAVLRQKLPFWDDYCRFRDINCRLGDKMPFSR